MAKVTIPHLSSSFQNLQSSLQKLDQLIIETYQTNIELEESWNEYMAALEDYYPLEDQV